MKKSNWSIQIQTARKAKGITQRDLAKRIGVTETAIKQFENSVNLPSYETVLKICEVLDTTWDSLFELELKNNDCATLEKLFNKGTRELFSIINATSEFTISQSGCTNIWYVDFCYDLMYFKSNDLIGTTKMPITKLLDYSYQLKKKLQQKYNNEMIKFIKEEIIKKKPD